MCLEIYGCLPRLDGGSAVGCAQAVQKPLRNVAGGRTPVQHVGDAPRGRDVALQQLQSLLRSEWQHLHTCAVYADDAVMTGSANPRRIAPGYLALMQRLSNKWQQLKEVH